MQAQVIEQGIAALAARGKALRRLGISFGIAAIAILMLALVIPPGDLSFDQGFGSRVVVPGGIEISEVSLGSARAETDWGRLKLPAYIASFAYLIFISRRLYRCLENKLGWSKPVRIWLIIASWVMYFVIAMIGLAWPFYKAYRHFEKVMRPGTVGRIGFGIVAIPLGLTLLVVAGNIPQFVAYATGLDGDEQQLVIKGYYILSAESDTQRSFDKAFENRLLTSRTLTADARDKGWYVLAQQAYIEQDRKRIGPYLANMTGTWRPGGKIHSERLLYLIATARVIGFRGKLDGAALSGGNAVWPLAVRVLVNALVAALMVCLLLCCLLLLLGADRAGRVERLAMIGGRLVAGRQQEAA